MEKYGRQETHCNRQRNSTYIADARHVRKPAAEKAAQYRTLTYDAHDIFLEVRPLGASHTYSTAGI
jgi:hypothetical protein